MPNIRITKIIYVIVSELLSYFAHNRDFELSFIINTQQFFINPFHKLINTTPTIIIDYYYHFGNI